MTVLGDLNDFIARSRDLADDNELQSLVGGISREIGFDNFSLFRHDVGSRADTIRITDYPEDWVSIVVERRYYVDDPVYQASRRTGVGFRRADLHQHLSPTARQVEILEQAEAVGLGDWFAVPAHVANETSGLATFIVRTGRELPERSLPAAQLVGAFGYEAARRLRRRASSAPAGPVALTPRQVDCLLLVARGKTDWEVGRILGLSEETVGKYMDDARRRYDVSRRSQLVVRALYDGHFSIQDAVA